MIVEFLFGVLTALVLVTAVLSVISKQLIHAALWLVVTLGAVAGVFLTLGAELLAWVQVLVYVGAVVVLIVFALMLTRRPTGALSAELTANSRVAAVGGALAFLGLGATFVAAFHGERIAVGGADQGGNVEHLIESGGERGQDRPFAGPVAQADDGRANASVGEGVVVTDLAGDDHVTLGERGAEGEAPSRAGDHDRLLDALARVPDELHVVRAGGGAKFARKC